LAVSGAVLARLDLGRGRVDAQPALDVCQLPLYLRQLREHRLVVPVAALGFLEQLPADSDDLAELTPIEGDLPLHLLGDRFPNISAS